MSLTLRIAWQTAERVSVRLAARGTVQEPRYGDASYYQQSPPGGMYNGAAYLEQQQPPPQALQTSQPLTARVVQSPRNKRQASEEEEAPPKVKRPRAAKPSGLLYALYLARILCSHSSLQKVRRSVDTMLRSVVKQPKSQPKTVCSYSLLSGDPHV